VPTGPRPRVDLGGQPGHRHRMPRGRLPLQRRPAWGRPSTARPGRRPARRARGPSEMPFLTPTSMVGLPAKRPASLTGRSWAKITRRPGDLGRGLMGSEPAEPWVSTVIVCPRPWRRAPATLGRHVGVGDTGRAARHPDEVQGTGGTRRTACCGAGSGDPGLSRRDGLGHEPRGVADGLLDADIHGGLAREAARVTHLEVVREDHGIGRVDHRLVERAGARGALGLDEDLVACGLGCSAPGPRRPCRCARCLSGRR
jgi:hypothetical protein